MDIKFNIKEPQNFKVKNGVIEIHFFKNENNTTLENFGFTLFCYTKMPKKENAYQFLIDIKNWKLQSENEVIEQINELLSLILKDKNLLNREELWQIKNKYYEKTNKEKDKK